MQTGLHTIYVGVVIRISSAEQRSQNSIANKLAIIEPQWVVNVSYCAGHLTGGSYSAKHANFYQMYNSILPGHNIYVGCRLLNSRRPHIPSAPEV